MGGFAMRCKRKYLGDHGLWKGGRSLRLSSERSIMTELTALPATDTLPV